MQNTELRRRARPVLDALRTLALQGRTPVLGLRKKSRPYHSWDTVQEDPAEVDQSHLFGLSPRLDTLCPR